MSPEYKIIDPYRFLKNFSNVSEFVIHDHLSYYFKHKLNPCQYAFFQSKPTITSLVSYLDFSSSLVCSQRQVDAIYFDFSSAFDLLPHTRLLHKLCAYELSDAYVSWLRSFLTSRYFAVRIPNIRHVLKCFLLSLKYKSLVSYSLIL